MVYHWTCMGCGGTRMQYADCQNVETMCRQVLDEWLRRWRTSGSERMAPATPSGGQLFASKGMTLRGRHSAGPLSPSQEEDAYGDLLLEAWRLYLDWDPELGMNFQSYGFGLLRRRVNDVARRHFGRNGKKPLANSIPLTTPVEGSDTGDVAGTLFVEADMDDLALDAAGAFIP